MIDHARAFALEHEIAVIFLYYNNSRKLKNTSGRLLLKLLLRTEYEIQTGVKKI